MSLDRLQSNELVMTQELIANMLGVRREGITEAAGHLSDAGLIRYHRDTLRSWIVRGSNSVPASAMPRSGRSTNACFRQRRRSERPSNRRWVGLRAVRSAGPQLAENGVALPLARR
jgi:hypothetical protein